MTTFAPGWPGITPRWTSSAKSGVGTALGLQSRVWFTLSHGVVNEIYYPRVDQACIRDFELLVTDGHTFVAEEKRDTRSTISPQPSGAPAYEVVNRCVADRFVIHKQIITDPTRDVFLQRVRFQPAAGFETLEVYGLLAPHLGNRGWGNTAWVGDYKGHPMLFAERDGLSLALACSVPWLAASVGFVGFSDGWQDLTKHRTLTSQYERAENGNVALTGQLDWRANGGECVLALGFGTSPNEAGQQALASLEDGFDQAWNAYNAEWDGWLSSLEAREEAVREPTLSRISRVVLRSHESKQFPGAVIASLSIPWGMSKSDDDLGGYHLVWPRDLVETAGALLSVGAQADAIRVADYLQTIQEADGHWAQNMWLDGTPYWGGVQMDETAFPILLVDLLRRELGWIEEWKRFWPMVRQAASYIVCHGPVTAQDRWEEDPGYSPFTLAAEVAALLAAADMAELAEQSREAQYLRETADIWNEGIERWTYTTGTILAAEHGVEGYYVRIAPPDQADGSSPKQGFVPIKNRPPGESPRPAEEIVSPDALALVRFGLRSADDPRILDTVRVIDALLRREFAEGPVWYRYNDDGYGEHIDGSPFDGTGIGRPWPLLTGERAHYELAAGRMLEATQLCEALAGFASVGGMFPEQVWDAIDIPERELYAGGPSGSAMPLVWAHAEYLKLLRSLRSGRVYDMPPQPVLRYQQQPLLPVPAIWRFNQKCRTIPVGQVLRVELLAPARVGWTSDGWRTIHDATTVDSELGIHFADLDTAGLPDQTVIDFTMFWLKNQSWEGTDYHLVIQATP